MSLDIHVPLISYTWARNHIHVLLVRCDTALKLFTFELTSEASGADRFSRLNKEFRGKLIVNTNGCERSNRYVFAAFKRKQLLNAFSN